MKLIVFFLLIINFKMISQESKSLNDTILENSKVKKLNYSIDIFPFLRTFDFKKDEKTINPNNEIAKLDELRYNTYFRPDLKYENKNLNISFKPRLNFEFDENFNSKVNDIFIQELKVNYNFSEKINFVGGRYFKSIGISNIINPSNVFFLESVALNPKIELLSMDFVEFKYSINDSWNMQFIANVSEAKEPIYKKPFFEEYQRRYALLLENYSNNNMKGVIFSADESGRLDLGYYGQLNVNEAFLFWIDGKLNYNPYRFYPIEGHPTGLVDYAMINGEKNEKLFITNLIGMSYTFKNGSFFNAEYYYNGLGFDNNEIRVFNNLINDASNYTFDITKEISKQNLGRAINPGMTFIRQNYLFTQFGQNDLFDKVNYFIRYFHCFDDKSNQISSLIEWNILENVELNSVILFNLGKDTNSFNRLINNMIMFGLIYRI